MVFVMCGLLLAVRRCSVLLFVVSCRRVLLCVACLASFVVGSLLFVVVWMFLVVAVFGVVVVGRWFCVRVSCIIVGCCLSVIGWWLLAAVVCCRSVVRCLLVAVCGLLCLCVDSCLVMLFGSTCCLWLFVPWCSLVVVVRRSCFGVCCLLMLRCCS